MKNLNSLENNENILENNKNIIKSLKQNFWEDIKSWISENIKKTEINWLEKINSKIWNYFLSSCFHPDEFWIWSYRPTSLINILEISKEIWLSPEVEFLDSLRWAWLKWFPNIPSWKNKPTILNQISKMSEEKLSAKEYFKESNKIFENIVNSTIFNMTPNTQTIKYFDEIFDEVWILKTMEYFFENNNFTENEKNNFKTFILKEKSFEILEEVKNIFRINILKKDYKWKITPTEVQAELQNSILTVLFKKYFPKYIEDFKKI